MKRQRPTIKINNHYMMIEGEKVEIDLKKTGLPLRCKLALAEIVTGQKYELLQSSS